MSPSSRQRAFLFPLALAVVTSSAQAVIVNTPIPSADHSADPGTGVPWDNVLNVVNNTTGSTIAGSSVYLGGGWLLTAEHVYDDRPTFAVSYDGIVYTEDLAFNISNPTSFPSQGLSVNTDLTLVRLQSDLSLPTISLGNANVGDDLTLIGYGGGIKRWGTNEVETDGIALDVPPSVSNDYVSLSTDFDLDIPGDSQAISGDSGGGVFYQEPSSGEWQLAGILSAVNLAGTSTFSVDLNFYDDEINSIILANGNAQPIPEPSVVLLSLCATFGILRRKRLAYSAL